MIKDERKKLIAVTHVPSSEPYRYLYEQVLLHSSQNFSTDKSWFLGFYFRAYQWFSVTDVGYWRVTGFLKLRVKSVCITQRPKERQHTVFKRLWQNILTSFRINNQLDASNIQNLFCHETTCFGHLLCPSSGVISCKLGNWYVSYRVCDRCLAESGWALRFQPDSARHGHIT